jgi:adenylate cyclase
VFFIRVKFQSFGRTILYASAIMIFYFWFVLYELMIHRTVFDLVTPEVFMLMGMLAGTLWWSSSRDRELQVLQNTMAQLVSPSVYKEVLRQKKGIQPGGQRLEITSMLVDIRDFTALSENLPAQEVTDLLNAFYTEVEKVIFDHRGTIDKYMGDGVLIMFGAPLETPDHADMAVQASKALVTSLRQLGERWWQERHIFFNIGVSINSGHAYVGFVGPTHKLEYTALGDTVNLCVRLQTQNKEFATPLILSDYTVRYLKNTENLKGLHELGEAKVRGREMPVKVHTYADFLLEASSPVSPSV